MAGDDAEVMGTRDDVAVRVFWDSSVSVVRVVWPSGAVVGAQEAAATTSAVRAVGRGTVPLLVDMREMSKLERGAREHYKADKGGVCAMALLVGSPLTRMLANFFMSTDPDGTPVRMFTDEAAALEWLRAQRE
jgi:hypothetical protein